MALIKLEDIENVGANKVALLRTELLYPNMVDYVTLRLGGTTFTKSHITNIKVKLSSKTIWDISGDELQDINEFEGIPSAANQLVLPFGNPRTRDLNQQYLGALNLFALGIRRVDFEITIGAATAPTLTAKAEIVKPFKVNPQYDLMFRALYQTQLAVAGAVTKQAQPINYGQTGGAVLRAMHFFLGGNMTSLNVKRNSKDIFEEVAVAENNDILQSFGWVPQTNVYHWQLRHDDNEERALPTVFPADQGGGVIPQAIQVTTSGAVVGNVKSDCFANLNAV